MEAGRSTGGGGSKPDDRGSPKGGGDVRETSK